MIGFDGFRASAIYLMPFIPLALGLLLCIISIAYKNDRDA